jgi:hypothetical protein
MDIGIFLKSWVEEKFLLKFPTKELHAFMLHAKKDSRKLLIFFSTTKLFVLDGNPTIHGMEKFK